MSDHPTSSQSRGTPRRSRAARRSPGRHAGRTGNVLVPELTPTQHAALWGLVRWPFISAQDLCLGLDGPGTSTVYHALSHLQARSLIEWVPYVSSRAQHERLWYLADGAVRLAAGLAGADPTAFAHAWGLGEAALVRRLGRLEHLTLCRGFLMDLQAALRARRVEEPAGPFLAAWQPWPVRLAYHHRQRRRDCTLDGAGTLSWTPAGTQLRAAEFVLVWDAGGGLALEVLRPRLVALLRARAAREQAAIRARATDRALAPHSFPTVLLVAARPERARGTRSLAADIARRERVPPLALLLTSAQTLRARGLADAPWRDQAGREGTLAALLAPHAVPSSCGTGQARAGPGPVRPTLHGSPRRSCGPRRQALAPVRW
jgi:hypothetical protein